MNNNELTSEDRQKILAALIAGQKIVAIKLYREKTGLGLKEAHTFISELQKELGEEHPELLASKGSGCSAAALLLIVLFSVICWFC